MTDALPPAEKQRRLRAWLQLARLSNVPTVWSNVVFGLAAGYTVALADHPGEARGSARVLGLLLDQGMMLLVGMSLLYTAGMVLNDACDAGFDRRERAQRPIPEGRITRGSAFGVGSVLMLLGVACSAVYTRFDVLIATLVLVAAIIAYNVLHKRVAAAFVCMGACRMLVVWTAGLACAGMSEPRWWLYVGIPGLVLGIYTFTITLLARHEHTSPARRHVIVGMIVGMPILDAAFAAVLGVWAAALFCAACIPASLAGQRWIRGT